MFVLKHEHAYANYIKINYYEIVFSLNYYKCLYVKNISSIAVDIYMIDLYFVALKSIIHEKEPLH